MMHKKMIHVFIVSFVMIELSPELLYSKKLEKNRDVAGRHRKGFSEKDEQKMKLAKNYDWTPLQNAIDQIDFDAHPEFTQMLIGFNTTDDKRHQAYYEIAQNRVERVASLIDQGQDIHQQGKYGNTPLIHAMLGLNKNENILNENYSSYYKIIKYLIGKEAQYSKEQIKNNLNIENIDGLTALDIAALRAHWDIVVSLLDIGADINYVNSNGQTVLDYLGNNKIEAIYDMGWTQADFDMRMNRLKERGAISARPLSFQMLDYMGNMLG